ncbi:hypothetical protein [Emticicia sp. BO119]|uniref:hypothetical protein n=1 Tax=Emticicia sp. BO119 TaxID=2757768 RepID=UPI0015F0305B|nr:hypothetical protein [Emticicia sp. BO119]MBA4850632.1 hypothetical protein [Emticicia sp. BO119]
MNTLLKDWNLIRILRLIAGVTIISMSIAEDQLILSIIGFFLLAQAIFNSGCGVNGCNIPSDRRNRRRS